MRNYAPLISELNLVTAAAKKDSDKGCQPICIIGNFLQDLLETLDFSVLRGLVIENTAISFYEDEILSLIVGHLEDQNLARSASALVNESGNLNKSVSLPAKAKIFPSAANFGVRNKSIGFPFKANHDECKKEGPNFGSPRAPSASYFDRRVESTPRKVSNCRIALPAAIVSKSSADDAPCISDIIGQYFRNQHRSCEHPVAHLPPFSMTTRHSCWSPPNESSAITSYLRNRSLGTASSGSYGRQLSTIKFSKLSAARSRRDSALSCSEFSKTDCSKLWVAGLSHSDLGVYLWDFETGDKREVLKYRGSMRTLSVHNDSLILTNVKRTNDSKEAALWRCVHESSAKKDHSFSPSFTGAVFSPTGASIGGLSMSNLDGFENRLEIFDTATTNIVSQYSSDAIDYSTESFYPVAFGCGASANLVCAARCLFDTRSEGVVHSFDFLSEKSNCCFHPNGNNLAIADQIWDLRYSKNLLKSLPDMNSYVPRYSMDGSILYGYLDSSESCPHSHHHKEAKFFSALTHEPIPAPFDRYDYHLTAHATMDSEGMKVALITSTMIEATSISVYTTRKYPSVANEDSDEEWAEENEEWGSDSDNYDDDDMDFDEDMDEDYFDEFGEDEDEEFYEEDE